MNAEKAATPVLIAQCVADARWLDTIADRTDETNRVVFRPTALRQVARTLRVAALAMTLENTETPT